MKKRRKMRYGDCDYCDGKVLEEIREIDFRWRGKLYVIANVPVGVCQQCGEKYFTAEVSERIDKLVTSKEYDRVKRVPVKNFEREVA